MIVHTTLASCRDWRLSDLLKRLGDVDPRRIRLFPPPGTATDEDCAESKDLYGCLCEMVDGVLVEKVMGASESMVAIELSHQMKLYLASHPIGVICGADGPVRVDTRVIRMPDISFVSWDRIPGDETPQDAVLEVIPDLVVEVISRSNRPGEMQVKLREYFAAGVRMAWYIYPEKKKAAVYTSLKKSVAIGPGESLDGGSVLPGFKVKLQDLFAKAFPQRPKKRGS